MAFHRLTIGRCSRNLLAVFILLHVIACGGNGGNGGDTAIESGSEIPIPGPVSTIPALKWIAPSERVDGTPLSLSDIAEYRIYYGSSTGSYTHRIDIADSTADELLLTGLLQGQYFFTVTVVDSDGRESEYSAEVSLSL